MSHAPPHRGLGKMEMLLISLNAHFILVE